MTAEEFMKQQYLTLRDEIRTSKSRIFYILVLGTVFIPVAGFAAMTYREAFASASLPFIVLVLMLAFVMEQSSIIRAGRYLKEHVEPHIEGIVSWEAWLAGNNDLRDMDRYFFASFIIVFCLFYMIGVSMAFESMAKNWAEYSYNACAAYAIGGLWFIVVLLRHWRACTTTTN
jgi:hypothetical protein